jgi:hypothetical protein
MSEVCQEGTRPSTVDASQFVSGTPTQQRAFAIELAESVRRCGFVKVINHGLSDELIDELFAWVSVIRLTASEGSYCSIVTVTKLMCSPE